jgi:hypothetical protein
VQAETLARLRKSLGAAQIHWDDPLVRGRD